MDCWTMLVMEYDYPRQFALLSQSGILEPIFSRVNCNAIDFSMEVK